MDLGRSFLQTNRPYDERRLRGKALCLCEVRRAVKLTAGKLTAYETWIISTGVDLFNEKAKVVHD